jgi:hypothetical protein
MLRSGVSFPAIMKLLGHKSADMTTLYVDVVQTDLQREFHQAQSHPRYIAPRPQATLLSPRPGLDGVIDSLLVAQHTLEMFRRTMEDDLPRRRVDRFSNRLTKILAEVRKLTDKNGHRLAGYAELGITGLMPSTGLCRVLRVNGSGAGTESWVCSA